MDKKKFYTQEEVEDMLIGKKGLQDVINMKKTWKCSG